MVDWSTERAETIAAGSFVFKLLDKDGEPLADLHGATEWEAPETVNATEVFTGRWAGTHPVVDLLLPLGDAGDAAPEGAWRALVDDAQWIMVQAGPSWRDRLVYRVARITDNHGRAKDDIEVEAESLFRHVEKIAVRADPTSPLALQVRYRDTRGGQSHKVLKDYLLVNLRRDFQPGGISGWDLWTPSSWAGIVPDLWPIMVNPRMPNIPTVFTLLDARFDMAADLFAETLDAAGLQLTADLWLVGDPQPFPEFCTLTAPTIVLDVVPRGWDTSVTGHLGDALRGLVRSFDAENNAPVIGLGDRPHTHDGALPWIVWRPAHMRRVTSAFTVTKSTDWRVTVGGRSPEAINRMLAGTTKAIFNGLGFALASAIPVFGGLLVAGATLLGEWVSDATKDKLFAWASYSNAKRKAAHGRLAYRDQVYSGDGWSLQSMQQGYSGLAAGAGSVSVAFETDDAAPYRMFRDFRAGDQCGAEHRGLVFGSYIHTCSIGSKRGEPFQTVELGDPEGRESPVRALAVTTKGLKSALDRVKTFIN